MTKNPIQHVNRGFNESATPAEMAALFRVVSMTSGVTGREYLRELVRAMTTALDVAYASVAVFTDNAKRMRVLAFWDGVQFREPGEYCVGPTPCSRVVAGSLYHCSDNVQEEFPEDARLKRLGVVSYRGIPAIAPGGKNMGHIVAMDRKPMNAELRFATIMQLCATRVAAELIRMEAEDALRASESRLSSILHSAMDPTITFHRDRRVTTFNRAAERAFLWSAEDISNRVVDPLLDTPLAARIRDFIAGRSPRGREGETVWLPDGLHCTRANGDSFPIEGTLSQVPHQAPELYALVLRDVNEHRKTLRQVARLAEQRDYLEEEVRRQACHGNLIGDSAPMRTVAKQVELVAPTDAAVLILGETGTGKELLARAVHAASGRAQQPLVKVDCAALPPALIESELFGHEEGAFTGAIGRRQGRFELADGGTVFLDEVGELPLELQPKLLRLLQEKEFERVGGNEPRRVDVRVLAATNRKLADLVQKGEFRADLFYRLNVFPIHLPPLRDRDEDIIALAEHFARANARRVGRPFTSVHPDSLTRLRTYGWPGNVRELQNVIERAIILSDSPRLAIEAGLLSRTGGLDATPRQSYRTLAEIERDHIVAVLRASGGTVDGVGGAAATLAINPSTLRSRMGKLGIDVSDYRD